MAMLIAMLCAGLYGRTADFPMTYDDCAYMKDNPLFLQSGAFSYLASFRDFALWPLKAGLDADLAANMLLRPLAYATLHGNHALDGFEPRWFRVVNIVIHALNGLLIFGVLRRLRAAMFIAVVSALLFTVHPLAVESVTYIVQRFTSLGTLWVLLCLWFYLGSLSAEGRSRHWLRGAAVVAALAGMLTKEDAVMVPLLAVGLDWLVLGTRLRTALWRALPLLGTLPVVPVMVMAVSAAQNGGEWSLGQALQIVNLGEKPWGHGQYVITQWTVLVEYLRLIVWPSGQNICHDWPVKISLFDGAVLRAVTVLVSLLCAAWWLRSRRWMGGQGRLVFAFVLWFFGTISVSSGLVPLPEMMAEHRTYLPSIGILVALACMLERLSGKIRPVAAGLVVAVMAMATLARNEVWRTGVSLWSDAVAKSPAHQVAWNNFGSALFDAGDFDAAEKAFRRALEIDPHSLAASRNLSSSLVRQMRWQECHEVTAGLLSSNAKAQQDADVLYNAAISLAGLSRHDEATELLAGILRLEPDHFFANKLLGMIHHHHRHVQRARQYLSHACVLRPEDPDVPRLLASLDGGPAQP
jgi:uncharacterized protein HemY